MKKQTLISLMIVVMTFMTLSLLAQAPTDSIAAANIAGAFNLNYTAVLAAIGVISYIIGHFFVNGKWYSYTLWAEKVAFGIYSAIKWFNDKTNKDIKK